MSDLPRLLLCSFDVIPGPSGSSRRLTEYLKALPDRFSVVVLSAKTPDHSHIEKYQGARLLRVPVGSGDLASRIQAFERAVRRQLESEEYTLAHFMDPFGGYALCERKGDYGYRLIYEAQTFSSQELPYTHPQTEGDKRFLAKVRRQELFCLMNADRVITGSQTTRAYIQSLGASTEQTRVLRAPVDLAPYRPEVLGKPDGTPMRLMYLGSQAGWQGLPVLLRAMALAVEQQAQVRLTLVGARHPDWQPHLEDLAKELGIHEHVEFQPPVLHDDVAKVLALADVGVLPLDDVDRNRLQGGPLAKVSEYFAAGRPVITSDLPVTRELIPGDAAVFHAPGNARELAERILELAQDVPRRVELGRRAREFAEQEFDAGLIRGQLLDIYDDLLGQAPLSVSAPVDEPLPTMVGTPTGRLALMGPPETKPAPAGAKPTAAEAPAEPSKPPTLPPIPWKKGSGREELPLVRGQVLEEGLDTRLIKTEPDVRPNEPPPVVMGLPLRDKAAEERKSPTREGLPATPPPLRPSSSSLRKEEPPALPSRSVPTVAAQEPPTPIVPIKTLERNRPSGTFRAEPPPLRPSTSLPSVGAREAKPGAEPLPVPDASSDKARPPSTPPALPPRGARMSGSWPAIPPKQPPAEPPPKAEALPEGEAEEISDDEAQEIPEAEAQPVPAAARTEEPEEISNEEIQETPEVVEGVELAEGVDPKEEAPIAVADDMLEVSTPGSPALAGEPAPPAEPPAPEPPVSALDPWFAQLAHGYCPPEGAQFARHTPPTTFPGRDEEPTDPSREPPAPRFQGAARGKSS
nr:glycosyltransferase family 4 protein [Stigmatella hybrida]